MRDRRYQVFVSSTFTDLREERQRVHTVLLELGCIPAGMEYFPASDLTAWALVERVIDDSDYYLVIVGGRYGSVSDNGLSFTEREYEYALQSSKPILAFVHDDLDSIPWRDSEQNPQNRKRLKTFVQRLRQRHVVRTWTSPDGLKAAVATSLTAQMELTPQPGWSRSIELPERRTTGFEIIRSKESLRMRVDGFDNDLYLEIRAATSGLEVFYRDISADGSSSLTGIELATPGMTLLEPLIDRNNWTKAFVYLGRQFARGETTTVRMREKYSQNGQWDTDNIHACFVSHFIKHLELEVTYPEELRPVSARWVEYLGDISLGEIVQAGELDTGSLAISFTRSDPVMGNNYVIEWRMQ